MDITLSFNRLLNNCMRYNEKMHPLLGNAADIIEKNYDYGWKVKDVLKVL